MHRLVFEQACSNDLRPGLGISLLLWGRKKGFRASNSIRFS